ncbi:glycoside hydrolase family 76 protein [Dysgonomonas sp. Marseille-P4677]|uniref:glycoside hydrolase family 76 protein n=1 Tax=Dysgonomonas sp. Marseille-P4677 TaxID=2364790 RepID=UPI001F3EFDDF|nr:glycoside hydrolase family 76 protein [Dysgonomonas sp. Marseille-P4677]
MMKKIFYYILSIIFFLFISCDDGSEPYHRVPIEDDGEEDVVVDHKARAKEIYDIIYPIFNVNDGNGLFLESVPAQAGDPRYSYLWPYDATISAASVLTELGYDVNYEAMVDRFEKYFRVGAEGNNIGGYGSSTNGSVGGGTRFYDDNSIVGINLIDAYRITKKPIYLERAQRIVTFLKSGQDNILGGALWWNESEKNIIDNPNSNKPTCSNGYAIQFLLRYYEVATNETEKAEVLDLAKSLYKWLRDNLYDSYSGCYWNDKNVKGEINKTIWTYNTGVMMQNGLLLYKITKDQTYLDEAKRSANGSYDYFVRLRNGVLSFPDHDPWFSTKLLGAYIDMQPYYPAVEEYIEVFNNYINYAYENARMDNGLFYEDWTGIKQGRYYSLLMQSCVVETYGLLALYNETKNN